MLPEGLIAIGLTLWVVYEAVWSITVVVLLSEILPAVRRLSAK